MFFNSAYNYLKTRKQCLALLLVLWSGVVCAQQPWDYSPYEIKVWTVFDGHPSFDQKYQQKFNQELASRAWSEVGSVWNLNAESAPGVLIQPALRDINSVNIDLIKLHDAELLDQFDKLILVVASYKNHRIHFSVRELDCRTRSFGPPHRQATENKAMMPDLAFQLIKYVFSPIGLVDKVEDLKTKVVLKAQSLIVDQNSPANLPAGSVLYPILRMNDRTGKLREKNGIQHVDWTYLQVTGADWSGKLCKVVSGYGRPLAGRKSVRIERLALAAKPHQLSTQLTVLSKQKDTLPIEGYEVYAKDHEDIAPEFVGTTDFHGRITIPQTESNMLRLLYVRSGNNLLARLPMVPGLVPELTAYVSDDSQRLKAEGYINGWRDNMVDVVARRQLLARRIRVSIEKGEVDKAKIWLVEIQKLKTIAQLKNELRSARGEFIGADLVIQARINKMIAQAQEIADKHQDSGLIDVLKKEIQAAEKKASS